MNKFFQIAVASLASLVLAYVSFSVTAGTLSDEISDRIRKIGDVCVEGEDCSAGTANTQVAAASDGESPKAIYDRTCATCHAIGVAGAPKLGDVAAWAPRIEKGMAMLYEHSINGLPPGMPAKGMCFNCSDDQLKAVVDYMVAEAE